LAKPHFEDHTEGMIISAACYLVLISVGRELTSMLAHILTSCTEGAAGHSLQLTRIVTRSDSGPVGPEIYTDSNGLAAVLQAETKGLYDPPPVCGYYYRPA
jgi:hypothetical protein